MDTTQIDNCSDNYLIDAFIDLDADFDLCVSEAERARHQECRDELKEEIEARGYTVRAIFGGWEIKQK